MKTRMLVVFFLSVLCSVTHGVNAQQVEDASRSTSNVEEAERLAAKVEELWVEIDEMIARYAVAQGDERMEIDARIDRRADQLRKELGPLIEAVTAAEPAGESVSGPRAVAERMLDAAQRVVEDTVHSLAERSDQVRLEAAGMAPEDRLGPERRATQLGVEVDSNVEALFEIAGYRRSLGLDVREDLDRFDTILIDRAVELLTRIQVAESRTSALREAIDRAEPADQGPMRSELMGLQERVHGAATSLSEMVELLDDRQLDSAEYKQQLIRTTGTVTSDILDPRVALGLAQQAWRAIGRWILANAPQMAFNILAFLLIVFVFRIIARVIERMMNRTMARTETKMPTLLSNMLATMVSRSVFVVGVLIALGQLGVQIGPLLAGLGVAGFIVGFALQDSLSNFASGVMILIYRPFDVGDVVQAGGVLGTVRAMSLVSTTILTFDNRRMFVPNSRIWGDVIQNNTAEASRRVDLVFSVSYECDVDHARRVLEDTVRGHESVLDNPEPQIQVNQLAESSVDFIVRPWVKTPDYWAVYWDLTRRVKQRFDSEGIEIPYPRRKLILEQGGPAAAAPGAAS